jgi:chaperonin GroES
MKYLPLGDQIVAVSIAQDEVSEGGIFIPEMARKTFNEAVVHSCGPEVPDHIKEGCTVVFEPHSEARVKIDGEHYVCVAFKNVLLYKPAEIAAVQNGSEGPHAPLG